MTVFSESSPVAPPFKTSSVAVAVQDKNVISLNFQIQKAKELQEADLGPFFGFIGKNEIANARRCLGAEIFIESHHPSPLWDVFQAGGQVFSFAVGSPTEYAKGSDFADQVCNGLGVLSYFGIVDLA